jgi:hypothetical protein
MSIRGNVDTGNVDTGNVDTGNVDTENVDTGKCRYGKYRAFVHDTPTDFHSCKWNMNTPLDEPRATHTDLRRRRIELLTLYRTLSEKEFKLYDAITRSMTQQELDTDSAELPITTSTILGPLRDRCMHTWSYRDIKAMRVGPNLPVIVKESVDDDGFDEVA